jgi:hypothetical protein
MAGLSVFWPKLAMAVPLLILSLSISVAQALWTASSAVFPSQPTTRRGLLSRRALTALLHIVQPIARLLGRTRHGLTLWRNRLPSGFLFPKPRTLQIWSEEWQQPENNLIRLKSALRQIGACATDGGDFDRWDMELKGGAFGKIRLLMVVEEHGSGKQMFRFRLWPACNPSIIFALTGLLIMAVAAYLDGAQEIFALLLAVPLLLGVRTLRECGSATSVLDRLIRSIKE